MNLLEISKSSPLYGFEPSSPMTPFDLLDPSSDSSNTGTDLGGPFWYDLDPTLLFNAKYNYYDYNNGACNGYWKDARFMKEPFI